jgi:hypothetical protein
MTRTVFQRHMVGGAAALAAFSGSALAQGTPVPRLFARAALQEPITLPSIPVLRVGPHGRPSNSPPPPTDSCNVIATLTDASFQGGNYLLEAGMAQGEMAAATYTIPASEFPITINSTDVILATSNATVQTVTQWSMLFYSGTPATGALVATYSSDDVVLPYARVGPGTAGIDVQFSIDPTDPEQLIISDDGSHKFTIAFRIDHHNQQTQNPCFFGPPTCCNAFPCVDTSGLQNASTNWLNGVNCGSVGCPPNGGWSTFAALSSACRPSGDWVMRATWSGVDCTPGVGACCLANGTCQQLSTSDCGTAGGIYQGDGSACASANCPVPSAACCFGSSCIVVTQANCASAAGTWLGVGSTCAGSGGTTCPTGGCCLPDGSCATGVTSAQCTGQGGTFRGVGTDCTNANCPQPSGACCTNGGANCGLFTSAQCTTIGGVWHGAGSTCANACPPPTGACCTNGGANCGLFTQAQCTTVGGSWQGANTTCANACAGACYANCDHSTTVPVLNVLDFSCFLNAFAAGDTYANCDASTTPPVLNVLDFSCFLNRFAAGCT